MRTKPGLHKFTIHDSTPTFLSLQHFIKSADGITGFFAKRKKDATTEMSFIDHLEELRWHIIRMVIAIIIGAIIRFRLRRCYSRQSTICSHPRRLHFFAMAVQTW